MKKKPNINLILAVVLLSSGILMLAAGIGITVVQKLDSSKNNSPSPNPAEEEMRESKKETIDYDLCNVEPTLIAKRKYKSYEFTDIKLSSIGDYYYFTCTVTNTSKEIVESLTLNLTFYSNNKKELGKMELIVPTLNPKEKAYLSTYSDVKEIFEAFDFTMEPYVFE